MESIVITGATGFIGRHLVRYLSEQGFYIYALASSNSSSAEQIEAIPNTTVLRVELREYPHFLRLLPKNPLAFIHLAWIGVSPECRSSTLTQVENINLCMYAVQIAAALGTKKFIFPGSTMEYAYCGQKVNSHALPSPQNAYGSAKIAARYLCASLCEESGISYIYTVITGIYSADRTDNNVIYYSISQLLQRNCPSFTRLEQLWDYVHIDDVVRALYLIIIRGKNGAFYCIGHGDNWPLSKYIYQIRDLIDSKLPLKIGDIPYKDNCLPSSCVDLSSIHEDTGFEPEIPFEVGIQGVIKKIKEELKQNEN